MADITGTPGDDNLNGTNLADKLDGGLGNDKLFGVEANDQLLGGLGDDELDGGLGNDTLIGGAGNDTYFIDSTSDKVTEKAGEGVDNVVSAIDGYKLAAQVENLTLSDMVPGVLNGTGNELNNVIDGNSLANALDGGSGNDDLRGGFGGDTLLGGAGNDILDGGAGFDTLKGGAGNDTYKIDSQVDIIVEAANQGIDTIQASFTTDQTLNLSSFANVENIVILGGAKITVNGNDLGNTITGNSNHDTIDGKAGNDVLYGGAGNDILTGGDGNDVLEGGADNDTMTGGKGNDVYILSGAEADVLVEAAGGGTDEIQASGSYDLKVAGLDEIENLTLTGSANLDGTGNNAANVITGNTGDNVLSGGLGNDTLIGGAGNDTFAFDAGDDVMSGGIGNDTYFVTDFGDKVIEQSSQGQDVVVSILANYTLAANVEDLTLQAMAGGINGTGNNLNNVITGNAGINRLNGGAGDDQLIGGLGDDELTGGTGNDLFVLDNPADTIIELANGGSGDAIMAGFDIDLTKFQNVESIIFNGKDAVTGTGNALNNYIQGNDAANTLTGGAGNDTLVGGLGDDTLKGGDGNDILAGGNGADTLEGGKGNDIYEEFGSTDKITEAVDGGIDEIRTTTNTVDMSIASLVNIENLTSTEAFYSVSLTGNALNNVIVGSTSGSDKLFGNEGNDTLIGGIGLYTNKGGNDTLDGGIGNDVMIGGTGNDTYFVDSAQDKVIENGFKKNPYGGIDDSAGFDTVKTTLTSYTLAANVENLFVLNATGSTATGNALDNNIHGDVGSDILDGGAGNDNLYGYAFDDTLIGNAGDDNLFGGLGIDTLKGGAGNDNYYIDATDKITEAANAGIDTIFVSFSVDLNSLANVENVVLEGAGFSAAGNAAGNKLVATDAGNVLDGRAGNDYLVGGLGADALVGGDGNDILDDKGGVDDMTGGKGNDVYYVNSAQDKVTEIANEGIDEARSTLNFSLVGTELENLILLNQLVGGPGDLIGTGNAYNNVITGNDGANVLRGGAGNDTLIGGLGNDELFGETGIDKMSGGFGADKYHVDSAKDVVTEKAFEGIDTVFSTLDSYTLGANLENLTLEGPGDHNGVGNSLNNIMLGNDDKNNFNGGSGDDTLQGGIGDDTLLGGVGNDRLEGGAGNDTMTGGAGNDTYQVDSTTDIVAEVLNGGTDTIEAFVSITLSNNVENAKAMLGNLIITGNDLNNLMEGTITDDTLNGGKGADTLLGGAGADHLNGGEGDDIAEGGFGADVMSGGAGKDVFLYRWDGMTDLDTLGHDQIINFEHGIDKIDLHDIFSDFGITSSNPFADGYLKLDGIMGTNNIVLSFDNDGAAGGNAFIVLATLSNMPNVPNATNDDIFF